MHILGFIPIPSPFFIPLFTLVSRMLRTPILIYFYLANMFCVSNSLLDLPCFSPTCVFPLGYCLYLLCSVQFTHSCPTLCHPMDCSMPGLPVHDQLPEFIQTHVHWLGDAIQPSHPLLSPSSSTFSLSQHQGLFSWLNSLHQVAKILEFQIQHQSFQWTPRTDLL